MNYWWLLNIFISLLSLVFLVSLTYQFQIKEYRFDRLASAIKEAGLLTFLIPERFVLPKKSIRNFTLVGIAILLLFLYELLIFVVSGQAILFVVLNVTMPIFVSVAVIVGVLITEKISTKNRNIVINQAIEKRNKSKAVFIGITGSFGKSTTKEFVHTFLSQFFATGKTLGNYNTPIGVAMSINQELHDNVVYFVTEMGAYKSGEIKDIASFIKPQYAIITGLGNQHLSLFGSLENLVKTKAELVQALPQDGIIYLNADGPLYKEILKYCDNKKVVLYSATRKDVDVYLDEYHSENGRCAGKIIYGNETFAFTSKLMGRHFVSNLLPAIALSFDLGVSQESIVKAIASLENAYGKLSTHVGLNGATYFYDGYSSNVAGFISAIDTLNTYSGKKYIVTKGIIELGKEKKESYTKILEKINNQDIKLVTTDRLFKKLGTADNVVLLRNESHCANFIKAHTNKGSVVLIEGRFSDNFTKSLGIK